MVRALSPEQALSHLAGLSSDVREAVVLDRRGRRLAGHPALAGPAAELQAASTDAAVEVFTDRGAVYLARSARHAVVVVAGRFSLPSIMLYDLRLLLADLAPVRA